MDVFRFLNPGGDTLLTQGQIVNGITDLMWVERFQEPGEFTIKSPISSNVREMLPTGCLISHIDSTDIMIVENHEISEDKGSVPEIVITGRSFETILEQRVVGANQAMPANASDYILTAATTWNQIVTLIKNHTYLPNLVDPKDAILHMITQTDVTGTGVSEQRVAKRGTVSEAIFEILGVDQLGMRVIRPGTWSPLGATSPDICLLVHKGTDRSQTVIFSYDAGDIDNADYLWSIKSDKNAILVSSRWFETMVKGTESEYDRRMMIYDASFLDNNFSAAPGEPDRTTIINALISIGKAALARRNYLALSKADVARTSNHYEYRKDYQVGDIVTVAGDYNEAGQMRVIEYVEIEDNTGESGYPTLAAI